MTRGSLSLEPTSIPVDRFSKRADTPTVRFSWARIVAYGVLPTLALILALGAGYLKWHNASTHMAWAAAAESVQAARDCTVAMLSYRADTADRDLTAARDRLTGDLRDSYTKLIDDVVIPAAEEKQISAVATVPAAASVSDNGNHAVVLVFVNQITTIGTDPPSDAVSSVLVTLDKLGERWLISRFEPL